MAVTYTRMGLLLWGSQAVGEPTPGQRDTSRAKRKVVKMLIVVVVMFGVCWLPYQLYFIISHFRLNNHVCWWLISAGQDALMALEQLSCGSH
ncbi:hypothetical protein HAZT_HAZT005127 [Hyalella azteca]|uniref:G-protein coupled receptors family 1 profile domain-containing protein n=1 Tax=Hyalella azteca TaxID=294128 RepID=A0A6A0GSX6_HYAAZ|nr:hypothetical protein HAZT_HAZT005127 [Hyalella azteca]